MIQAVLMFAGIALGIFVMWFANDSMDKFSGTGKYSKKNQKNS